MTIQTIERTAVAPKTTADVLRHAALIIEERGWCQHSIQAQNGAVCAWGGILVAAFGDVDRDDNSGFDKPATEHFAAHVQPGYDSPVGTIATWNDYPSRTVAEVTSALRAAADEVDR